MVFPTLLRMRHTLGRAAALLAATAAVALSGCANPGSPHPPSLRLPEMASGFAAQRVGTEVRLRWNTPAQTTDGDPIRFAITAVVCRQVSTPAACLPLRRMTVPPGPAEVIDALPPSLLQHPAVLLTYRVELLNGSGRFASAAETFAASGPAPASVAGFEVQARPDGALLLWQPAPSNPGEPAARMEVRRLGGPVPTRAASPSVKTARAKSSDAQGQRNGEAVLLADIAPDARDPGGMVDREVRQPRLEGTVWTYAAQRVRSVTLAGHVLEVRGVASAPMAFSWRNMFAPAAPTGLASVPSLRPPAVDLSWEPVFDAGLTGYNVYRLQPGAANGGVVRLNLQPLPSPAFRDLAVKVGATYRYRVTALGAHGNESAPSAEIEETVR